MPSECRNWTVRGCLWTPSRPEPSSLSNRCLFGRGEQDDVPEPRQERREHHAAGTLNPYLTWMHRAYGLTPLVWPPHECHSQASVVCPSQILDQSRRVLCPMCSLLIDSRRVSRDPAVSGFVLLILTERPDTNLHPLGLFRCAVCCARAMPPSAATVTRLRQQTRRQASSSHSLLAMTEFGINGSIKPEFIESFKLSAWACASAITRVRHVWRAA